MLAPFTPRCSCRTSLVAVTRQAKSTHMGDNMYVNLECNRFSAIDSGLPKERWRWHIQVWEQVNEGERIACGQSI